MRWATAASRSGIDRIEVDDLKGITAIATIVQHLSGLAVTMIKDCNRR